MSRTLAYGDIIRIYCSLQDNRDGGNKTGGFLMSKGFADANIYFLKSEKFTEFELRNSLFEVLPYSSFEIHDEAKKKKEQAKAKNQPLEISENMRSSMKTEEEQFRSKSAKQRKMQINFDSEVVIKHVNSDGYLQGEFSCPETGIGSFKLILSTELSSDVKFKITRFRNSDKEAEQIQSKDEFILYHCSSHCYLNIGDLGEKVFLDKEIKIDPFRKCDPMQLAREDNEAYKYVNQRPLIKRPNEGSIKSIERYEVVNMSKPTLILNFLLQKSSRDEDLESEIQHNDVIYLRNTKNMSYLTADLWSGEVSLVSYTGQRAGDFPYQGIWEVSVPRDVEKGQVSNIKTYFLKHYITDKVVKVETGSSELKRLQLDSRMSFNQQIDTFKIVNYQQKKTLNHRDLIFLEICNSKEQAVLRASTRAPRNQEAARQYLDIGGKIEKIYRTKLEQKSEENASNYGMEITKGPLVNAFQIFKLEEKKLKQVNKILSCVEILTNFCDVLIVLDNIIRKQISHNRQRPELDAMQSSPNMKYSTISNMANKEDRIRQRKSSINFSEEHQQSTVEKFLTEYLNYYILNLVIKTIDYLFENIKKPSKKPDFQFMMMIRSLGLFEILIEAIFFIERNQQLIKRGQKSIISTYLKKKKYLRDRLQDCFKKIYDLLFELSQQNSCRLYLGKWFNMFMNQFYSLRSEYIHALIVALLKQKFIIKTLKTTDIEKCIQNMAIKEGVSYQKNCKCLELLSSFCRAKGTAIYENQRFIMKKLKDYPELFYRFYTQDRVSVDPSEELYGEKNQISFKEGERQRLLENYQGAQRWKYIIFLLNLYADLIYDHPYTKIGEVKHCINMKTVKAFFLKKDESEKKKEGASIIDSFLKLAHYFFLNELNESKEPIRMIDRQETLYVLYDQRRPSEVRNVDFQQLIARYNPVAEFIIEQILQNEQKQSEYNVMRLKTIQTSLDFIKTISRLDENAIINRTLKLLIDVVIKLKRDYIYNGGEDLMKKLFSRGEDDEVVKKQVKDGVQKEQDIIRKIDKVIDKNIRKLLNQKPMERLLIDTRSAAGEILNIRLNLLINEGLKQLSGFFTDVCQNKVHIEHYNRPRNSQVSFYGQNSHWIWINKIIEIADSTVNAKLNQLIDDHKNGKKTLVKLLIQCIFVQSLKIVNKIMMLIFRLYELRKTLMTRFKDTFIVKNDSFINICEFNNRWIAEFEKIKVGEDYDKLMKDLQISSFAIRFFDNKEKSDKVKRLFSLRMENGNQAQMTTLYNEIKKGLSDYIVLNQTETQLTTNQVLLQKMVGNQKMHTYILSYIKNLKQGAANYNQHLNIAYEFLTLLVYNNTRNKKMLTKDIKLVLNHIRSNCRAIEFMKKTIIENQNIINNRELVSSLVESILQSAHAIDGDQDKLITKAKLIESLRVFCVFEGKSHVQNQSLIMIQLQNRKYENSIMFSTLQYNRNKHLGGQGIGIFQQLYKIGREDYMLRQPDKENIFYDSYDDCMDQCERTPGNFKKYPKIYNDFLSFKDSYNQAIKDMHDRKGGQDSGEDGVNNREEGDTVHVPPSLLYLSAYFSTMAALVEGNHQINKGKCCNMHPYESMIELLQDSSKCWPLSRHGRAYLRKLYFSDSVDKKSEKSGTTIKNVEHPTVTVKNSKLPSIKTGNTVPKENSREIQNFLTKVFSKEIVLLSDRLRSVNSDLLDDEREVYKMKLSTPIRYQYMGSYLYCLLQQVLLQIYVFFEKIYTYGDSDDMNKKQKRITKDQSNSLKELLKLLGTTYQLLTKSQTDSPAKRLMQNIYVKCIGIVKIIDLQQENFLEIPDIEKKIDDKTRSSPSFIKLGEESLNKRIRCYNFMIYYFFLSYQEEKRILISSNSNKYQNDYDHPTSSPEDSIKKSFVRRLVPNSLFNKLHQEPPNEESTKAQHVLQQLQSPNKQIRVNRLLQVITEDLVQRKESHEMVQQQLDELVKLCSNLDQIDPNEQDMNQYRVIGYNKFMMNIITLVTKSPNHLTLEGKIKTINLIRMIFEEKVNRSCGVGNKQWESGFFQGEKLQTLKQIQNEFKNLNLDKMIVAILKQETQSYYLLSETFKLGIKFLYNGNSQCQAAILSNLKEDSENMVMVELFNFIKKMRSEISQGKFIINTEDQQENNESVSLEASILDTFHYFDMKNRCMTQLGAEKDNSKQFQQEVQMKIKCVCRAYQFLQLMCQNDNQTCKNFLRQQTNLNGLVKYNSINFVSQTSKLFKVVLENYDPKQKQNNILQYLADFFIEVTQLPCTENQLELCSTSIFSDIRYHAINSRPQKQDTKYSLAARTMVSKGSSNKYSGKFDEPSGPEKTMCYLMDFVINAGLSLLEGSSHQIYEALIASLDKQFIYQIFRYQREVLIVLNRSNPQCPLIHEFNDQTLKILLTDNPANVLIRKRVYMVYNLFALIQKLSKYVRQNKSPLHQAPLINTLIEYAKEKQKLKNKEERDPKESWEDGHITISTFCSTKLKHIEVVFQQKKQYLYFPDLPIFKKLSDETKQEILENIKRETQVDKITDFLVKSGQINNLMNWNYKVEDRLALSTTTLEWIRLQILFLTLAIVSLYIVFTSVIFVEVKGRMKMIKSIDNPIIESTVNILCVFHLFSSIYFVFTWCTLKYRMPIERQLKQEAEDQIAKLLEKIDTDAAFEIKDYWICLKLMLKNQKEIYSIILFFVIFSLMGYFVGIQWYSMLVFDMITRNKTLKNVIQAITSNLQQLLVVSLLILAFVYVFNIMSIEFSLYLPLIYQDQDEKCTVLSDCVISLYTSGEIGEKHKEFKFTKFIADLLYIVIMELLFSNIVSGIVIDTFAQLRDQRKTIETDTQTKCFICGISKATLQKQLREQEDSSLQQNSGLKRFKKHIEVVHSQWDYIYYLYILSQKDITTYTGIQYFIKKQYSNDQYDWIPTYEEEDDKDIKQILEITQRLVPKIKERLQNRNQLTN